MEVRGLNSGLLSGMFVAIPRSLLTHSPPHHAPSQPPRQPTYCLPHHPPPLTPPPSPPQSGQSRAPPHRPDECWSLPDPGVRLSRPSMAMLGEALVAMLHWVGMHVMEAMQVRGGG